MKKYREAIFALSLLFGVLLLGFCGLQWWISPIKIPDGGIWYCEDLKTTIDFESSPNVMMRDVGGIEQIYQIECAYSGAIYYSPNQTEQKNILGYISKELFNSNNSFVCLMYDTKEKYTFFRID